MKNTSYVSRLGVLTIVVCLPISACATDNGSAAKDNVDEKDSAATTPLYPRAKSPATLVLTKGSKCEMTEMLHPTTESPALLLAFAPLLVPIVQKLVTASVGFIYDKSVTYLNNRKHEYTASTTVSRSTLFLGDDGRPSLSCVEFVRGELHHTAFDKATYSSAAARYPALKSSWSNPDTAQSRFPTWRLSAPPEMYIAFGIEYAAAREPNKVLANAGNTPQMPLYFRIRPYEMLYLSSGAKRNGDEGKQVTAQLTLTLADGTILKDQLFDFGVLKPGQSYNLDFISADYIPIPATTQIMAAKPDRKPAQAKSNDAPKPISAIDPIPIKITLIVTELEEGGDFARAVATEFADKETRKSIVEGAGKQAGEYVSGEVKKMQDKQGDKK
jgi:hypothetical protein